MLRNRQKGKGKHRAVGLQSEDEEMPDVDRSAAGGNGTPMYHERDGVSSLT